MTNKEIAMKAMQELFVKRNADALNQYWKDPCEQHNPNMANGLEGIRNVLPYVPEHFSYDPGIVISEGDIVMAHSRGDRVGNGPSDHRTPGCDIGRNQGKREQEWNPMTSFNIHKYNMNSLTLAGNKFYATIGKLEVELTFNNDNTVTFIVVNGAGLTQECFLVSWQEEDKTSVVQIIDLKQKIFLSNITAPGGKLVQKQGTLS